MLKIMRDRFQQLKWILVLVILVFVVGFVLFDAGLSGAAGSDNQSFAASVNGESVSLRELSRAVVLTERQYEQAYGQNFTPEMRTAMNLPDNVLNGLIDEQLLLQEADRLELRSSPEEIRVKILEIPDLSPDGKFVGAELYAEYVTRRLGYASAAEFEEEFGEQLTLAKLDSALRNSIIVSPKMAEERYRRQNESAKIRYVVLSMDKMLPSVTATPAETEAYYRANSLKYAHPEQRRVKYLLADLAKIQSQINLTEEDLRREYETRKEEYRSADAARARHILIKSEAAATPQQDAAALARARDLVAQIRAGADFAALARIHSGDPSSGPNGGDLGFFEPGQMVPEFDAAAFSQPIGVISDPIKTSYGYHIIEVLEKRPSGYKSFEEVRAELSLRLMDERGKEMTRERINRVRTQLASSGEKTEDDLRKLADDVVSFNDSSWFGKAEQVGGVGRAPSINAWAFGATAKKGDLGSVLETPRGSVLPLLVDIRPAGISALTEMRAKVENDAKLAKARDLARQELGKILPGTATIEALAAKLGATVAEAEVTRDGMVQGLTGEVGPLINQALSSPAGEVRGPLTVDQGAIAFQVTEQKRFDPAAFETGKAEFVDRMRKDEFRKLRVALIDRLRRDAKIKINRELIQSTFGTGETQPGA